MRVSVVIHPEYRFLQDYIESIPTRFELLTKILYKDRNVIKLDETNGLKLVIKSYGRIYLTNRIRYSYFHASKAERAFTYGTKLLEKGFKTPQPVAYIEEFDNGLLRNSYFVSLYTDFQPLSKMMPTDEMEITKALAAYTFDLHKSGIYHMDYSRGNILCKKGEDGYQFSLIDNNRMRFGQFSFKDRLKNFRRLGLSKRQLVTVAREYARLENRNERETTETLMAYVAEHEERHIMKKRAKEIVGNVFERISHQAG